VPVVSPLEDRLEAAIRSGLVSWNGRRLHPRVPVAKVRRSKTVAELVLCNYYSSMMLPKT
jgi:hypothetical protein